MQVPLCPVDSAQLIGLLRGIRILVVADPVFSMLDARAQANGAFSKVATAGGKQSLNLMAAIEDESGGVFKLTRLKETEELAENLRGLYGATATRFTQRPTGGKATSPWYV